MKDIIIAVDFSKPSLNAARYAAAMLSLKPDIHVILYNMFSDEKEAENAGNYLETLKTELLQKGVANNIECIKEYGDDLIDCLGKLAHQKTAELIIMGIAEKEEWKQIFTRSIPIKMAEKNVCPVMIIPPGATYNGIKNIALTSEFKNVETTTPILAIKTILKMFNASLHIVNVDHEHYVSLTEEILNERDKMLKIFADHKPEFYFIGMNDFHDAVEQFAKDKNIDLIITIPRNDSFLSNLISGSQTEKLAYQSSVPILAAHE